MLNKNICKQLPGSTSELSYNAGDTVPLNKCSAIYVGQKFLKYVRYMQAEHLNMLEGGIIVRYCTSICRLSTWTCWRGASLPSSSRKSGKHSHRYFYVYINTVYTIIHVQSINNSPVNSANDCKIKTNWVSVPIGGGASTVYILSLSISSLW